MNKYILFLVGLLFIVTSCKNKNEVSIPIDEIMIENYDSYGEKISVKEVYDKVSLDDKYKNLDTSDTIDIAFISTVNAVCKAKGCWMRVALKEDKETMVKFKDYGFFVPKDIENDTVIVQGRAFVSEVSVEEQRHYARDAGKSEDEIMAITAPKKTYSFISDGVLIKKQ
ncbi:DUF4920 domain-containing protein [Aquimarina mytili]|uniref:DUF4920 domain-containing protein n=1 Tax=Aquimarina mytili TaxID=874423 RepID=A0A936ZZS3_9FLAO|nr:DUF4920 domain-containing protein [Aquimarina mytili]MBL0684900.1 DUF4920 domain-containing protein [Aquimarina mytili]